MNIKFAINNLIITTFFFTAIATPLSAKTLRGKVINVADGDTLTIVDSRKFKYRIRLMGIDAPEKDQPHGNESTQSLRWLVLGKEITVKYSKYDRYGRILGKVLLDSHRDIFCLEVNCIRKVDVGLKQVGAGSAWHYKRYQKDQSRVDRNNYSDAEGLARKKKYGLWNDKKPKPPWKWRRDNRLEALRKRFTETQAKEKTYAMALRMDPDQLKIFLNEAIWNAFEASGMEEEEFAVEFKVSPDRLRSILEKNGYEK